MNYKKEEVAHKVAIRKIKILLTGYPSIIDNLNTLTKLNKGTRVFTAEDFVLSYYEKTF
jgi:hypothetical protein